MTKQGRNQPAHTHVHQAVHGTAAPSSRQHTTTPPRTTTQARHASPDAGCRLASPCLTLPCAAPRPSHRPTHRNVATAAMMMHAVWLQLASKSSCSQQQQAPTAACRSGSGPADSCRCAVAPASAPAAAHVGSQNACVPNTRQGPPAAAADAASRPCCCGPSAAAQPAAAPPSTCPPACCLDETRGSGIRPSIRTAARPRPTRR